MRTFPILILIVCLVARFHSRPLQMDENSGSEMEESEYEGEAGAAADDSGAEEDSSLKDHDTNEQNRHFLEMNGNTYHQRNMDDRSVQTNPDEFSDYKLTKNKNFNNGKPDAVKNSFDEYQTISSDRLSNRYIENNDANEQQETAQHLTNRDVNNYDSNRCNNVLRDDPTNKKSIGFRSATKEEGDMLFEINKEQLNKVDKSEHSNDDASGLNQQYRQYYNPEQTEDRVTMYHNNHDNGRFDINRNRRQAEETNQGGIANDQEEKEEIKKNNVEDEESAIKRHIKKMSGEELEQLLNSLSLQKRELLKKIIDSAETAENGIDSISKREITKKAGAVGENNYEGGLTDSSKIQEDSPFIDLKTESSVSHNSETTETNKRTESQTENDLSSSKSVETTGSDSKIDISSPIYGADERKVELNSLNSGPLNLDSNNKAEVVSNLQIPPKNENKRETRINDSENISIENASSDDTNIVGSDSKDTQDSLNDHSYFYSQDEDLSQLLEDEAQLDTERGKTHKREIQEQNDLSDSFKSLEESFPNSAAYSDESGPYTGNLIRVKRRNSDPVLKKRSAAFVPDAKVPYFPYRAENDDEDNDEGNEFDDEGFYDPTSHLAKYNDLENLSVNDLANSEHAKRDNTDFQVNNIDRSKLDKPGNDRMSLGSDADNVLSGVEGVDENLMYNTALRNRRTPGNSDGTVTEMKGGQPWYSSSLANVVKESDNYNNAPSYQENDAFGPLPKNYDSDLARYKRIRRVNKQSDTGEEETNSDS